MAAGLPEDARRGAPREPEPCPPRSRLRSPRGVSSSAGERLMTVVTGNANRCSTRRGRSRRSQRDTPGGNVDSMISSNVWSSIRSSMARTGLASPTTPSAVVGAGGPEAGQRLRPSAGWASARASPSVHVACSAGGVAGTSSVKRQGPRRPSWPSTTSSSSSPHAGLVGDDEDPARTASGCGSAVPTWRPPPAVRSTPIAAARPGRADESAAPATVSSTSRWRRPGRARRSSC